MTAGILGLARYRFRTTWAQRWTGYLTTVVLIGIIGGVAMGSIAAARRTQAAFPTFLASTNPSNLGLVTSGWQPGQPNSAGSSLAGAHLVARLPLVSHVADAFNLNAQPINADDSQKTAPAQAKALGISTLNNYGSTDGEFSRQDRATAIQGRLPDPNNADEIDLAPIVAEALNVHVGDKVLIGFYTNDQTILPGYGSSPVFRVKPYRSMNMKVVGLVDFNDQVVVDSLDITGTANILYSRALTRQLLACCVTNVTTHLKLAHGNSDVPRVEAEINQVAAAQGFGAVLFALQPDESVAERAIRPESIALAVFGAIAALAALLIAGQAIGRQLRLSGDDRQTLRAARGRPRGNRSRRRHRAAPGGPGRLSPRPGRCRSTLAACPDRNRALRLSRSRPGLRLGGARTRGPGLRRHPRGDRLDPGGPAGTAPGLVR